MTSPDIVIVTVMALSGFWGVIGGFWGLVLGFAAWGLAIWVTLKAAPLLAGVLRPHLASETMAMILAVAIIFVLSILLFSLMARRLATALRSSGLGGVDRLLGFLLGMVLGAVLLVILLMVLQTFFGIAVTMELHGSTLAPYIEAAASHLRGMLPHGALSGLAPSATKGHDAAF